jgi:hypothetical protein
MLTKSRQRMSLRTLDQEAVNVCFLSGNERDALNDISTGGGLPEFPWDGGLRRFFHTPADDLRTTSPEILEPVARAFADAVRKAAERGEPAFK